VFTGFDVDQRFGALVVRVEVRGRVVELTEEGADAHIDSLAKMYLGVDRYPHRQPGETRVIYRIQPEHTATMG
jgi:hypothetical protein